jgi:hypothetical protein
MEGSVGYPVDLARGSITFLYGSRLHLPRTMTRVGVEQWNAVLSGYVVYGNSGLLLG